MSLNRLLGLTLGSAIALGTVYYIFSLGREQGKNEACRSQNFQNDAPKYDILINNPFYTLQLKIKNLPLRTRDFTIQSVEIEREVNRILKTDRYMDEIPFKPIAQHSTNQKEQDRESQ